MVDPPSQGRLYGSGDVGWTLECDLLLSVEQTRMGSSHGHPGKTHDISYDWAMGNITTMSQSLPGWVYPVHNPFNVCLMRFLIDAMRIDPTR